MGLFRLTEDYKYKLPWKPNRYVVIPAGFITNFASIPWFARWIISPSDPNILIPALVHDYLVNEKFEESISAEIPALYECRGSRTHTIPYNWDDAAYIMRRAMKYHTPNASNEWQRFKRFLVLMAVRGHGIIEDK